MNQYHLDPKHSNINDIAKMLFAGFITKSRVSIDPFGISIITDYDIEVSTSTLVLESSFSTKDFEEAINYGSYPIKGDFAIIYSSNEAYVDSAKSDLDYYLKAKIKIGSSSSYTYFIFGRLNKSKSEFYTPISKGNSITGNLKF